MTAPLRTYLSLLTAVVGLAPLSACKRTPHDAAAPAPRAAAAPVEELPPAVDALTPPPRPRPPDFSTPPPPANTMNGHPNGPRQAEFEVVQADAQRKVQACLDAIPATTPLPGGVARLAIKYEVGNDGHPKDVNVSGELPPATLSCSKAALEGVVFPKFEGAPVRNAFSLTYSRAQPADLGAP